MIATQASLTATLQDCEARPKRRHSRRLVHEYSIENLKSEFVNRTDESGGIGSRAGKLNMREILHPAYFV